MDIQQGVDRGLRELALFAGAGGGILGGKLLGWRTVCAVEVEPYPACVLAQRQNDGVLAPFPIWDDVCTFDGRPWRGIVDVVSGGFPCQDISAAGKGVGIGGERSGLWREMVRIIGEVRPRYVWVENSPMLVGRGLGLVLLDLAKMGFSARWGVVGACDAGAPHRRERIWIAAFSNSACRRNGCEHTQPDFGAVSGIDGEGNGNVADAQGNGREPWRPEREGLKGQPGAIGGGASILDAASQGESRSVAQPERSDWWAAEPNVGRVAHGVAARVDRLKAIGNGQVPAVVRLAWNILSSGIYHAENEPVESNGI